MKSGFREHLAERLTQLETLHSKIQNDSTLHSEAAAKATTEAERAHEELLAMVASSRASQVFEVIGEYKELTRLFDLEFASDNAQKIENVANFVSKCIDTCENIEQVNNCENLINNMILMFPPGVQIGAWKDSLHLKMHNKLSSFSS